MAVLRTAMAKRQLWQPGAPMVLVSAATACRFRYIVMLRRYAAYDAAATFAQASAFADGAPLSKHQPCRP